MFSLFGLLDDQFFTVDIFLTADNKTSALKQQGMRT
jgi:hypothetical protein